MHMITRTCRVLPKVISEVRRATALVDLQGKIILLRQPPLVGSSRRLGTSQVEGDGIRNSGKTLSQTKKEQRWCYDPTIKYEAVRQCAVPRYAYYDDSTTDWTDSSDYEIEIETETVAEKEVLIQKERILAVAKKEQPFEHDPDTNYEVLKEFIYIDSPDSYVSDSETETETEAQARVAKFLDPATQAQIFPNPKVIYDPRQESAFNWSDSSETETGIMVEEAQTHKDKFLAEANDEQLLCYDPQIKYEPLKRYVVPRFAFGDSSSTDWSDSESETETMVEKEAQSQKVQILARTKEKQLFCDDLVKSPSTDLQFVAKDLAKSPSAILQI